MKTFTAMTIAECLFLPAALNSVASLQAEEALQWRFKDLRIVARKVHIDPGQSIGGCLRGKWHGIPMFRYASLAACSTPPSSPN